MPTNTNKLPVSFALSFSWKLYFLLNEIWKEIICKTLIIQFSCFVAITNDICQNHFLRASGVLEGVTHERRHICRLYYLSKAHPTHNNTRLLLNLRMLPSGIWKLKPSFTRICIQMSFHFCYYWNPSDSVGSLSHSVFKCTLLVGNRESHF